MGQRVVIRNVIGGVFFVFDQQGLRDAILADLMLNGFVDLNEGYSWLPAVQASQTEVLEAKSWIWNILARRRQVTIFDGDGDGFA